MAKQLIAKESMISIDGRPPVPLSSLTPEEKAACWDRIARRIGQVIHDYVNCHPEHYETVLKALLDAGGELISESELEYIKP